MNYPVGYPPFPVEVSTDHTFQRRAPRAAYPFRWACRFGENTRLPRQRGALVGWPLSPRERVAETPVVRSTNTLPSNGRGVGGAATEVWANRAAKPPGIPQRTRGRNGKFATGGTAFLWKALHTQTHAYPAARVLRKTHAVFQPGWSPPSAKPSDGNHRRGSRAWPKLTSPSSPHAASA